MKGPRLRLYNTVQAIIDANTKLSRGREPLTVRYAARHARTAHATLRVNTTTCGILTTAATARGHAVTKPRNDRNEN